MSSLSSTNKPKQRWIPRQKKGDFGFEGPYVLLYGVFLAGVLLLVSMFGGNHDGFVSKADSIRVLLRSSSHTGMLLLWIMMAASPGIRYFGGVMDDSGLRFLRRDRRYFAAVGAVPILFHLYALTQLIPGGHVMPNRATRYINESDHKLIAMIPATLWHLVQITALISALLSILLLNLPSIVSKDLSKSIGRSSAWLLYSIVIFHMIDSIYTKMGNRKESMVVVVHSCVLFAYLLVGVLRLLPESKAKKK